MFFVKKYLEKLTIFNNKNSIKLYDKNFCGKVSKKDFSGDVCIDECNFNFI